MKTAGSPKPNLLMVCYHFPPMKTASLRAYYLGMEALHFFEKVTVVSTTNTRYLDKEELPLKKLNVLLAPTLDFRTLLSRFGRQTISKSETQKGWLTQFVYKLFDTLPFGLLMGEGGIFYILSAYRMSARLVREEGYQYVFSTFRPYSSHVVAWLLKKRFPKLYWVADFRDLPVDPIMHNVFFPQLQHWLNKRILSRADLVTTVSKGLDEILARYTTKRYVLPNGVGRMDDSFPATKSVFEKFTIAYTGSMYRDKRNPELLLQVLHELISSGAIQPSDVQILHAGRHGLTWNTWLEKYGLSDVFNDLGLVAYQEARQIQNSAHINLLLTYADSRMTGNVTGKLWEYLAAGQPVLLLLNGEKDEELEEIFESTNAGVVARNNPEGLLAVRDFLSEKYREWKSTGTVRKVVSSEAFRPYQWDNLARTFFEKKMLHLHATPTV